MALTLGVNSWVTVAEADSYFEDRINSEPWDNLSEAEKSKYLVTAFRWLFNDPVYDLSADSTDQKVKDAQCEAAFFLINYGSEFADREALIASGVEEFKLSKWEEKLSGELKKPKIVDDLLGQYSNYGNGFVLLQR